MEENKENILQEKPSKLRLILSKLSDSTPKLGKRDWIIMGFMVVLYLMIALYNLGSMKNPQTFYHFADVFYEAGIEIEDAPQTISKIRYYNGVETGTYKILGSDDGITFSEQTTFTAKSVFAWEDLEVDFSTKYLKIVSESKNSYLGEIALYNGYGERIKIKSSNDQSVTLVDEMDTVPGQLSYLNSTYFDEIYFARSAYQYIHGMDAMEWVHPPLGKLIMLIPILVFGMTPFAYRLMGTLAGTLMIPVLYILAKRIFRNRKWAILAGLLMMFDSFHFAQTRMGTVDSFLVLFIMLSVLFMYQYLMSNNNTKFSTKVKNLALSGFFIGCAIATKWTGLYVGLGLAIVFFADLIYRDWKEKNTEITELMISRMILSILFVFAIIPTAIYYISALFVPSTQSLLYLILYFIVLVVVSGLYYMFKINRKSIKFIFICILFFIIVPILIYSLCYILFPNVVCYGENSISGIITQIQSMYHYHSTLEDTHFFSSNWYTWPVMYRPVWYYVGYYGGNIKSTIVGVGNPAIWWFGIVAVVFTTLSAIFTKRKSYLFIVLFILCTMLPYAFIGRCMFLYHYFPTLPFIMLAIVAFVKWITGKIKGNSFYLFYVAVVILLFISFYPVTSGMLTSEDYINSLKWLSSWYF